MALKMPPKEEAKPGVDYGAHLKAKPIVGTTTVQKSAKGVPQAEEVTQSETLHPGLFNTGMSIMVEGGRTLNLGNFESARIGVSITVPCEKDGLNEAYEYASSWVSDRIEEAVKEVTGK